MNMWTRMIMMIAWIALASLPAAFGEPVDVPHGIDHAPWERLLVKYVDQRGLVDYAGWKKSAPDLKALRDYTAQFAGGQTTAAPGWAEGREKTASLINAYNALTIQWILDNYPTPSIRSTRNPFGAKRHQVGGRAASLDEIEHDTLRPLAGYRVHAVLVCAARSCPPLHRHAFDADALEQQLDEAMRVWLAREDLNRFLPEEKRVELSAIFRWFREDFEKAGGLEKILPKYAPPQHAEFVKQGGYRIGYLPYDWGLNAQCETGEGYGGVRRLWDRLRNIF
jgi:hypothetical protein